LLKENLNDPNLPENNDNLEKPIPTKEEPQNQPQDNNNDSDKPKPGKIDCK